MILNLKLSELWCDIRGSQSKWRLTELCHVASGLSVSCSFKSVSVYETHGRFVFRLEVPPQYSQTLNNLKSNSISDMGQPHSVTSISLCIDLKVCVPPSLKNHESSVSSSIETLWCFSNCVCQVASTGQVFEKVLFRQDFTELHQLASNP